MKLRINFKPYSQIYYWTQAAKGEVSGWGRARKDQESVYTVTDIILLEQKCSGGFTDFTDEAITNFLFQCGKYNRNPAEFNFWWHSHCNMPTFWSDVDTGTMAMYSKNQPFIGLVTNKNGDMLAEYNYNGFFHAMPIVVIPTGCQDVQKQCYEEVRDKVSELVNEFGVEPVRIITRVPKGCGPMTVKPNAEKAEPVIIEIWDEDCGWRSFCNICGKRVDRGSKICHHCNTIFVGTERV